jgi:hypothetical protein
MRDDTDVTAPPRPPTRPGDADGPTDADVAAVAVLLGRPPQAGFIVAVRHADGSPLVIRNRPLLDDGTPMPTRWWLVGEPERTWVSRLESDGGVHRVEDEVDPRAIAAAHTAYAAERDADIPHDHTGPRPSGGVGGTRMGLKCLHAHYASWLGGADDAVGDWVAARLVEREGAAYR